MRKVFTNVASQLIENEANSALLLGDIGVFGFREVLSKYPQRVFNLGILEQSMISLGAGLSSEGIIPIIHTIAPFMVERAFEQIKIDFGYQNLPGNLVSVGASFDYTKLGCTHHCPADVNLLCNIPGIQIFIPGHGDEFQDQLKENWNNGSLNYFRLSEHENTQSFRLKNGEIKKIKDGGNGVVIVVGPMLDQVLAGTDGMELEIHYVNSISLSQPLQIDSNFPKNKVIIVEPYYSGALLLSISEELTRSKNEILQIGVPRAFINKYGDYNQFLSYLGLDAKSLRNMIREFLLK